MRILLRYAFFERRQTVYMSGRYLDEILVGMTKDEFIACAKSRKSR